MTKTTAMALVLALAGTCTFAQEAREALENYETSVTVYGERLPSSERPLLDAAAPVAILTREQIDASGAHTVQQLLERIPSVALHDQTGNPREATVDLRGFPQGTSVVVFLDGVRLNDLQDNGVRWDTVPLEDLERVEVYAGASAPLYGGGALAGVVNLVTRRNPGIPRIDLTAKVGTEGERVGRLHASGLLFDKVEFYVTGQKDHAEGWRQNDGHRLDDGLARFNVEAGGGHRFSLLLKYAGGELRQPGALTAAELAVDREQSPYNLPDHTRGRHRIASLRWDWEGEGWSLGTQAFARRHARETLTTGRWGTGFFTRGDESLDGLVLSARRIGERGPWSWDLSGGGELSSGRFDGAGYYTDAAGYSPVLASRTSTGQHLSGAWLSADLGRGKVHVQGGFRADQASYDYTDAMTPANGTSRTFRESTARLGLLYHLSPESSLFLGWSQGYRIPTVQDLFAYPGFYSNPDLLPARAQDWEAGVRYLKGPMRLSATLFRMTVRDETVFVLTDPMWFIGQNQNVGRSRRTGLELQGHLALGKGWSLFATGSYGEAEVTAGPYSGRRVPMTSRWQGTGGFGWASKGWRLEASAGAVGDQVCDNDLTNARPTLAGYTVLRAAATYQWRRWTFEASVDNALDREYSGRAITNGSQDYFTPAAPLEARLSVTLSF